MALAYLLGSIFAVGIIVVACVIIPNHQLNKMLKDR